MRNAVFWAITALLVLAALSATVSMMTVQWLYPSMADRRDPQPSRPLPPLPPVKGQAPSQPGPEEMLAMDLLQRAAVGDLSGAKALSPSLPEESLRAVTRVNPTPLWASRLPGPEDGPAQLLVWAQYRREGLAARGVYQVTVSRGKVSAVTGPLAPELGYGPLPWTPLDERARKLDMEPYRGRGLVLIAPRAPEQGLLETLVELQREYSPQGVEVVLVLDVRAPDWITTARMAGFSGPIWRVKAKLEDVPVVTQGHLLGAAGLLVDRQGTVVASLTALDPLRHGLADRTVGSIAPLVLKAYGLLP